MLKKLLVDNNFCIHHDHCFHEFVVIASFLNQIGLL